MPLFEVDYLLLLLLSSCLRRLLSFRNGILRDKCFLFYGKNLTMILKEVLSSQPSYSSQLLTLSFTGKHAFIGMGFNDRGDSFDFNVTLQDHFK